MEITLGSISMLQGSPWKPDKSESPQTVERRLNWHLIGAMDAAITARIRDDLLTSDFRIDAVACTLLRHKGVNPAIAASMAIHAETLSLTDGRGRQAAMITCEKTRILLDLRSEPMWDPGDDDRAAIHFLPRLPETVTAVFEPQPLVNVLSHATLNREPLRAERLEMEEEGNLSIHVSGVRELTGHDLLEFLA